MWAADTDVYFQNRGDEPEDPQSTKESVQLGATNPTSAAYKGMPNSPPSVASARPPPTAHFSALIHRNKDQTRKGRRTEAEGRREATGDRMKKRVRTACNTSCRDPSEDKWALGSTRWEQRTRETHTSITETNRLPSALVVVPSLSQLKNKGGDNREQLVTFRKLKSRMLLASKKAKCTL